MSKPKIYRIRKAAQVEAIGSAPRQEILDTVGRLGTCSIADVARALGRPADGLYFHVRILLDAGLIVEKGERDAGLRTETLYSTVAPGAHMQLVYGEDGASVSPEAVRAVHAMLGGAIDDFDRGLASGLAVTDGPQRNLWAGRNLAWLSPQDLRQVNALLHRLNDIFNGPRKAGADQLYVVSFGLAPIPVQPARRGKLPARHKRKRTS
jgi:DNA-binding transcriptional ArsR family regulator